MGSCTAVWQGGPNSALDDAKELPRDIQRQLYKLSNEVLVDTPDPALVDVEQRVDDSLLLRRAVTNEDWRKLAQLEDGDPSAPETVDYWYLYRAANPAEVLHYDGACFIVCRIVHVEHFAYLFEKLQTGG